MRRSLSRIVALLAPIFMLGVFFASPASAHHTTVSGEVECVQGEGYLITWTIQNSENIGGTADVSASAGALSSTSVALPANRGSVQVTTTHAVAETVTLTVSAEWTNKVKSVDTGKVKASDFPECDEPDDDYQIQPEKSWLIDGVPTAAADLPEGSWAKIVIFEDIVQGRFMVWKFDHQGRDHDGWLSYGAGMPVVIDEEYYVPGYSCEPVNRIFSGDDLVTVTVVNDCTEDDTPPQKVPNNPEYNRIEDCGWIEFTLTNNVELGDNEYAEPAEFTIEFKGDVETYTVPANGDPIVLTYSVEEDAGDEDIVINGNVYTIESDCLPDEEPPPEVKECPAQLGSIHATNLNPNGWSVGGAGSVSYVPGGVELSVDGSWAEVWLERDMNIPLAQLGDALGYIATPSQYVGIHIDTPLGTLVYEDEPSYGGLLWSNSPILPASGGGHGGSYAGTLNDALAINPDLVVTKVRLLYTNAEAASTVITSAVFGCVEYTFDEEEVPPQQPDPEVDEGEWVDGTWKCNDTTVTQTRTVTTTPYKLVDNEWVLDTENATTTTETRTRDLTAEEQTKCPPPPTCVALGNCPPPPPPPPPPVEECPEGQVGTPPNCETPVTPPTDVCPNVDGIQTEVPDGMFRNADGFCFPEEQPEPPAPPTPGGTLPRTGGGFGLIPLAVGFLLTGGAIRRLSKRQLA